MAESNLDKETERRTLSRLASAWSKVSKFTLQFFADAVPVTRSNLYAQVSDPDKGKRMGLDALVRAAFVTGVKLADDGLWYLVNGLAQQWPWKDDEADDNQAVKAYLCQIYERIGAKTPFRITMMTTIRDRYYQSTREYALIEFTDRADNEMTATLWADGIESLKRGINFFLESGVCVLTNDEIILTSDQAVQLIHGPIPKPKAMPNYKEIPWNDWINAIPRWHLMGVDPKAVETILSVARGGVSATEAKKQSAPDFIPGSENEPKSWKF